MLLIVMPGQPPVVHKMLIINEPQHEKIVHRISDNV